MVRNTELIQVLAEVVNISRKLCFSIFWTGQVIKQCSNVVVMYILWVTECNQTGKSVYEMLNEYYPVNTCSTKLSAAVLDLSVCGVKFSVLCTWQVMTAGHFKYSRLLLNESWRDQENIFHLTGVSFTERWKGVQNSSTKPIMLEAVVPFKQQFHLREFRLLRVYCIFVV